MLEEEWVVYRIKTRPSWGVSDIDGLECEPRKDWDDWLTKHGNALAASLTLVADGLTEQQAKLMVKLGSED
jgi:hypothetical protein